MKYINHLSHALSDDGRYVFFSTAEGLVPQDVNGVMDVYEYDASSGSLHLLSTGTDPNPSWFADATPNGSDVLIGTSQRLVGQDTDESIDLYDARVDGGLAAQNPPSPPPPCTDEAGCRTAPGPEPSLPALASSAFAGPGDPLLPGSGTPTASRLAVAAHGGHALIRLTVTVPGPGLLSAEAHGFVAASRSVAHAGGYSLALRLTGSARRALKRRHALRVTVQVRFRVGAQPVKTTHITTTVTA
jgi:hypothetical protein